MGNVLLFFLLSLIWEGVFCDTEVVSVKHGDSVTLHTNSLIKQGDVIYWKLGPEKKLIARINKEAKVYEILDNELCGKFKGRLKQDDKTGDLTITNIMTTDSGDYEVSNDEDAKKTFKVSVVSVDSTMTVSVLEGDLVTLLTDVPDIKTYNAIQWRFEHQKSLAEIKAGNIPKYDETDKRFKGKLQLDPQTGSLTIKNIRTEQAGLYEVDIIGSGHTAHKSYNVAPLVPVCGPSGWSSGAVAGIVVSVVVLLLVCVVVPLVIYYLRKIADLQLHCTCNKGDHLMANTEK